MREIRPINNNGSIQLKFSFAGKRHSFNPIPGAHYTNSRDLATARAIAVKIQNDILAGNFDPTLNRYRLAPQPIVTAAKPNTLLHLWDAWVSNLELSPTARANHYEWVRRMIVKANPGIAETDWLIRTQLGPRTLRDRLQLIRACCNWGASQGWLEVNPYARLRLRNDSHKETKPFTFSEIAAILTGFEAIAPDYLPFVKFLFLTGVRISEAIGLTWGHVDFDRQTITICESLSIDVTGNGYKRVRKTTKTGSIRHLPMNEPLRVLLLSVSPTNPSPDALVFTSARGCVIDSGNFRERLWVKVLKQSGVPYRKIHTIRHTLISHAIEQGIPMTGVAYLAGHKDTRMVMQTYGHMVNRPDLPEMPI
ncbi:site-specific integrase [Trichocoleus sp. FACHB-591]|uniref:site-specific integrase n=1 Tax=Trichocoleus sp. FACHB-591 TaxID=2692872 RepID=UPI0016847E6E|nr:site-specific integrase [Trichocoleus sp. FACHB-591]MBD2097745.1 site-specific integrase [Trichocoleus sp. FACHB-591]